MNAPPERNRHPAEWTTKRDAGGACISASTVSPETPVRNVTFKSIDTSEPEEKNGGRKTAGYFARCTEGNVKNATHRHVLGALAFLGAGLLLTGCKPDLTQANALALIQAEYDHRPATGITITVDELGLKQGITAKYWQLTKVYPNNRWADYTLTPEGKKTLTLPGGGDVIQWRPESGSQPQFMVLTVATNHLKARDPKEMEDEVLPGVEGTAKVASFTESVSLNGVPAPLQDIAHNPGNKLSTKRQAQFALDGGTWKLHAIE